MEEQEVEGLGLVEEIRKMDSLISSPDSAIDLTDDLMCSSRYIAQDIIDHVLELVWAEQGSQRRRRKKKEKTRFSATQKWELMRDCGVAGWRRILARNSDVDGGWGFNFIAPGGLRLNAKELDQFLKLRRLEISDLLFQEGEEDHQCSAYPRKKARITLGLPLDKIRDLKLSKKMELEKRKARLAQTRLENLSKPQFKSISEFLASLERCDSQNSNEGSCSDTSRLEDYSDSELEQHQESELICRDILEDCLQHLSPSPVAVRDLAEKSVSISSLSSLPKRSSEAPKSIEKLKIRIGEPIQKLKITPEKLGLLGKRVDSPDDLAEKRESIKVKIVTPNSRKLLSYGTQPNKPRLLPSLDPGASKFKRSANSPSVDTAHSDLVLQSNLNTSESPSDPSPVLDLSHTSTNSSPDTPITDKSDTALADKSDTSSALESSRRKYSIFKSRNSLDKRSSGPQVRFTDQNAGKNLCIRSHPADLNAPLQADPERTSKSENSKKKDKMNHNNAMEPVAVKVETKLEPDELYELEPNGLDELDMVEDEFSAEQGSLTSPNKIQILASPSKMRVVEKYTPERNPDPAPGRKLVFGLHSPICVDEIRPDEISLAGTSGEVKPRTRTHGRVISSEEAIKAIDAVVDLQEISKMEDPPESGSPNNPSIPYLSPMTVPSPLAPHRLATPSLPILSPQVGEEDITHSNMTTPSLPSLSPALSHIPPPVCTPLFPSPLASPSAAKIKAVRRQSGEGQLLRPDPQMSQPLSVLIPQDGVKNIKKKTDKEMEKTGIDSTVHPAPSPASAPAPVPRTPETATGRKMRDCRKFIHYEFSPPFISESEESSTDQESPDPPLANGHLKPRKKGRPAKKTAVEQDAGRKKKGKPEKSVASNSSINISDLAQKLSEDHISPITRERVNFSQADPKAGAIKSVSRAVLNLAKMEKRRASTDTASNRRLLEGRSRWSRSKSTDVSEPQGSDPNDLQQLKQTLRESQLLMKTTAAVPATLAGIKEEPEQTMPEPAEHPRDGARTHCWSQEGTLFVRKRVRVQTSVDPLFQIRDRPQRTSSRDEKKEDGSRGWEEAPVPGSCVLYPENLDLLDGLKVLTRIGSHFYPGRARAVEPPFIFAVSMEGERGNKPHIYTREEMLEKVLIEVKPGSTRFTPAGARVCTYWSSQLQYLYSGTVLSLTQDNMVRVQLDDGDERAVPVESVRLLPPDYPVVEGGGEEEVDGSTLSKLTVQELTSPDRQSAKTPPNKTSPGKYDSVKGKVRSRAAKENPPVKLTRKPTKPKKTKELRGGPAEPSEDATLCEDGLKDGLRVLARIDGHFYPGRLNNMKPPDIYGILLDNERGFRPHIYAREELLKSAIKEVRVRADQLAVGARVCAYWSTKYHFLHPGTVVPFEEGSSKLGARFLNIKLDDGDSREIAVDQIRLLPHNYPLVIYEPESILHSPGRKKKTGSPTPTQIRRSESAPLTGQPKQNHKKKLEPTQPLDQQTESDRGLNPVRESAERRDGSTEKAGQPSSAEPAASSHLENRKPETSRGVDNHRPENLKHIHPKTENSRTEDVNCDQPKSEKSSSENTFAKTTKPNFGKKTIDVPATTGPVDLVGLISKGIDRLVDKKVVGVRPDNHKAPLASPGSVSFHPPASPAHPGAMPFPPPASPGHPGTFHPGTPFYPPPTNHAFHPAQAGYHPSQTPHPGYHPSQSPHPGYHPSQSPHPGYHPSQSSQPGYHPSQSSHPGYHPSQSSHPGYHPSQSSHPGYHPSQSPHPGFPSYPENHPSQSPHLRFTGALPSPPHPSFTPVQTSQSPLYPGTPAHPGVQYPSFYQTPAQPVYPPYMPPPPFVPNPYGSFSSPAQSPRGAPSPAQSSRGAPSPAPSSSGSESSKDDLSTQELEAEMESSALPQPETGLKVKSRLSNLIAAVTGKISKTVGHREELNPPEESLDENIEENFVNCSQVREPTNSLGGVELRNSSFNKIKERSSKYSAQTLLSPQDSVFEEGYLTHNRIVLGTKVLVLRGEVLHPASIVGMEGDDYVLSFKNVEEEEKKKENPLYYVEEERKERTQCYSEKELINGVVLDIPAMSTDKLKSGSRVAVFPMQNSSTLTPGSVRKVINAYMIQVTLDTGPIKDINCEHVRIIPRGFILKKPTENGEEESEKTKLPPVNIYGSSKNKPNILLGYDYVDNDKSDLQAQWETAIARKSSKKPEKKPMDNTNLEVGNESNTPQSESTKSPSSEFIKSPQSVESQLLANRENEVRPDSRAQDLTEEEKMRQLLIIEAMKKYSPKKEPVKSPRATETVQKQKKKKSKVKDGDRNGSVDNNENDDFTKELLSICKESNIDTPGKNGRGFHKSEKQTRLHKHERVDGTNKRPKAQSDFAVDNLEESTQVKSGEDSAEECVEEVSNAPADNSNRDVSIVTASDNSVQESSDIIPNVSPSNSSLLESPKGVSNITSVYSVPESSQNVSNDSSDNSTKESLLKLPKHLSDNSAMELDTSDNSVQEFSQLLSSVPLANYSDVVPTDDSVNYVGASIQEVKTIDISVQEYTVEVSNVKPSDQEDLGENKIYEVEKADLKPVEKKDLAEKHDDSNKSDNLAKNYNLKDSNKKLVEKSNQKNSEEKSAKDNCSLEEKLTVAARREGSEKGALKSEITDNNDIISVTKNESVKNNEVKKVEEKDLGISKEKSEQIEEIEKELMVQKKQEQEENISEKNPIKSHQNNNHVKNEENAVENTNKLKDNDDTEKFNKEVNQSGSGLNTMRKIEVGRCSIQDVLRDSDEYYIGEKSEYLTSQDNTRELKIMKTDSIQVDSTPEENKSKKWRGQEVGHIDSKTFFYREPMLPRGWYVKVKIRTDGVKSDSYFFTTCNTMLRSKTEIAKFLKGINCRGKPLQKKPPIPVPKMPIKDELSPLDIPFTISFEKPMKEHKKIKKGNILKKEVLKPLKKISQAVNKSEKISNDPVNGCKNLSDSCFKVPTLENLRMLRSGRINKNPKLKKDLEQKNSSKTQTKNISECVILCSIHSDTDEKEMDKDNVIEPNKKEEGETITESEKVVNKCENESDSEDKSIVENIDINSDVDYKQRETHVKTDDKIVLAEKNIIEEVYKDEDTKKDIAVENVVDDISNDSNSKTLGSNIVEVNMSSLDEMIIDKELFKPIDEEKLVEKSDKLINDNSEFEITARESIVLKTTANSQQDKPEVKTENHKDSILEATLSENKKKILRQMSTGESESTKRALRSNDPRKRKLRSGVKLLKSPKKMKPKSSMTSPNLRPNRNLEVIQIRKITRNSASQLVEGTEIPKTEKEISNIESLKDNVKENCAINIPDDTPPIILKNQTVEENKLEVTANEPLAELPGKLAGVLCQLSDPPPPESSKPRRPVKAVTSRLRGPASKRKHSLTSSESEDEDSPTKLRLRSESKDEVVSEASASPVIPVNQIHSDAIARSYCTASMVNVFNRRLMETPCGHCREAGQFYPESLEVDLPSNLLFMECSLCNWTTIRKISVCNRVF